MAQEYEEQQKNRHKLPLEYLDAVIADMDKKLELFDEARSVEQRMAWIAETLKKDGETEKDYIIVVDSDPNIHENVMNALRSQGHLNNLIVVEDPNKAARVIKNAS